MTEFIGFVAVYVAMLTLSIPLGIFAWKLGCSLGGYRSQEEWGKK